MVIMNGFACVYVSVKIRKKWQKFFRGKSTCIKESKSQNLESLDWCLWSTLPQPKMAQMVNDWNIWGVQYPGCVIERGHIYGAGPRCPAGPITKVSVLPGITWVERAKDDSGAKILAFFGNGVCVFIYLQFMLSICLLLNIIIQYWKTGINVFFSV